MKIIFDTYAMVREIRIIKGRTGLFCLISCQEMRDGPHRQLAYVADVTTQSMMQRLLAKYEIVAESRPLPSTRSASERSKGT